MITLRFRSITYNLYYFILKLWLLFSECLYDYKIDLSSVAQVQHRRLCNLLYWFINLNPDTHFFILVKYACFSDVGAATFDTINTASRM